MEHNVTTSYLFSGKGDHRIEVIGGKPKEVQTWNKWCLAINTTRKGEILATIKDQDEELFDVLTDSAQKSDAFFEELASSIQSEIQKQQSDVDTIEFEFEGYRIYLSNLIAPGTADQIEHYYWCVEQ